MSAQRDLAVETSPDTGVLEASGRRNLSDDVCSYVRDLIMSGRVKAGEHLRIDAIAREVGVSITPVREGLLALSSEGFVNPLPRRGFVVAPLSARDLSDIFELQAYISGILAARAAETCDADFVARLRAQYEEHRAAFASSDPEAIEKANYEFHRLVHAESDSRKLMWVMRSLGRYVPRRFYGDVARWHQALGSGSEYPAEPDAVRCHRAVLNAIAAGDADAAEAAMTDHVRRAGIALATHLRSAGVLSD